MFEKYRLIYEKRGRYAEQNGDLDQRDIWFDKAAEVWSKAVRLYPCLLYTSDAADEL